MKPPRCVGLSVLALLFAVGTAGAQPWGDPTVAVGVDSRAFGTWYAHWATEWKGPPCWTWGTGAQVSVPVLLVVKGGGADTVALEVEGLAAWSSPTGWFARGRLATGFSTQTQGLGAFTSWTGSFSFEPGYRGEWGELWFLIRPQAALVTVVRPSSYLAATFDGRYEEGPSGAGGESLVLGLSAVRFMGGIGTWIAVTQTIALEFTLGVYPPLHPNRVGWMDGFSFGEIPFYSSLGCRFRP